MVILSLLLVSCEMFNTSAQYTYQTPERVIDGIEAGTLEEYFPGHKYQWDAPYHLGEWVSWDRDMNHHLMSSTKSVTSALIGIAIDLGFIQSVHQSIFDYLPEHRHLATEGKEEITIEHLLTMTSGLEWREWSAPYSSYENPCA